MPTLFNADEIFAIAVQVEANGYEFYKTAAQQQKDPENAAYLQKLADMEIEHETVFSEMRAQYAAANPAETSDLYNEGSMFLSAIADGYPIEGSPTIAADLTGEETLEQILEIAVDLEKKAILFYLGMKDVVPENLGRDKLDEIINEEKSHVVLLMGELKKRGEAAA